MRQALRAGTTRHEPVRGVRQLVAPGISDKVLDDICGNAPASIGQGYGRASLEDMAAAIRRLPRYGAGAGRGLKDHDEPRGARRPRGDQEAPGGRRFKEGPKRRRGTGGPSRRTA
jgi:hypothetical protein